MPGAGAVAGIARAVTAFGLIAMLLLAAGCGGTGTSGKGGGPRHGPVVFGHYDIDANPDGYTPGGPAFLGALRSLSGGRLAPVARNIREGGRPGILAAVRAGTIQGAWIQASDLEAAGVGHLAALSAPFEVTTYAHAAALAEPSVAAEFLSEVGGEGISALALLPGSLRRPAGPTSSLLGPDSWSGVQVWAASPTQSATFAALGARPTSDPFDTRVLDLPATVHEDLAFVLPYVTSNVVLWPRWWVLVVHTGWLESLSETERGWVDQAVEAARSAAIKTQPPESDLARQLCEAGARFASASAGDLAALQSAVEPVTRQLEADPADARLLGLVREARDTAVSAHDPSEIAVPAYCRGTVPPREQVTTYPLTRSDIPPGVYRAHLSAEDIAAAGAMNTRDAQVVTLTISPDGTYESSSRFDDDGSSMIFEAGQVYGEGHRVYFVNSLTRLEALQASGESACVWTQTVLGCLTNMEPYSVTWRLNTDGSLRFSDPLGMMPDPVVVLSMVANDFQRVS